MSKDWELEEIRGQAESYKMSPHYQGKKKIDKEGKLIEKKKSKKGKRICWCCKRNVPESENYCEYCLTEYSEVRPPTIIAKDVVLNHDGTWKFRDYATQETMIELKTRIEELEKENEKLKIENEHLIYQEQYRVSLGDFSDD